MMRTARPRISRKWCSVIGVALLGIGLAAAGNGSAQAAAPAAHPSATQPATASGGTYVALTPARVVDTRSGLGGYTKIAAQSWADVQIAGRGGVPATGVAAVVVQVTSTAATAAGFVSAYPADAARPLASNLNFAAGATTSNLVTVRLSAGGRIDLYNGSGGSTHLIVDVQGYFRAGAATVPGSFRILAPTRILDTRGSIGASGPVGALSTVGLQVAGRGGVPASGVAAVAVNVTVTAPTAPGYVTIYPSGSTRPSASSLNFGTGQTVPNLVIVPLGSNGKINLFNGSAGPSQLIADVQGYFLSGSPSASGGFKALNPRRILDTRSGLGGSHRAAANAETKIHIEGAGGVPASGVSAVVLNVTGVAPAAAGSMTAYPTGVVRPNASNLNFDLGHTRANAVIVPVDSFGWISLSNNSPGSVDELADVAGYFLGSGIAPNVIGPYTYGPFTMGMTMAQAQAVYPALNPTPPTFNACGHADLPQASLVFNHGTTKLSFVRANVAVQTGNGIRFGDTVGSILSRFPWAETFPSAPSLSMAVTQAEKAKARPTEYWFLLAGGSDPNTYLPKASDTVTGVALNLDQGCFD